MSNCYMCGRLTAPPHGTVTTARRCSFCDRDTFRLPAPDGLTIEAGDRVVFAPRAINLSLDRKTNAARFTRPGIMWFLTLLHHEGYPTAAQGVDATLDSFVKGGLKVLHESPLLEDLDLSSPTDVNEAWRRIGDSDDIPERWAGICARNARDALAAIGAGDAREAAFSTMAAVSARAMWLYADCLEELVWEGYLATGFGKLRALVDTWSENRANADESYWQQLLLNNPFLLAQAFTAPMVIHQSQAYVGGKEVDNRHGQVTDFMLRNELTRSVILVEIKTPVTPLLGSEYRSGVYPPSGKLSGAVNQLAWHRDQLLKEFYTLARGHDAGFDPVDPPGVVIAGDSSQLTKDDQRRSFELCRRSLKDTSVLTFDELFARTEALLRMATDDG